MQEPENGRNQPARSSDYGRVDRQQAFNFRNELEDVVEGKKFG